MSSSAGYWLQEIWTSLHNQISKIK